MKFRDYYVIDKFLYFFHWSVKIVSRYTQTDSFENSLFLYLSYLFLQYLHSCGRVATKLLFLKPHLFHSFSEFSALKHCNRIYFKQFWRPEMEKNIKRTHLPVFVFIMLKKNFFQKYQADFGEFKPYWTKPSFEFE